MQSLLGNCNWCRGVSQLFTPMFTGQLFTDVAPIALLSSRPVADKSRAFALCPHSLVSHEITQLRNGCPDFKLGGWWVGGWRGACLPVHAWAS